MHAPPNETPAFDSLPSAETIALAYRRAARGDAWVALVRAIEDALIDIATVEEHFTEQQRAVSYGYVRGRAGVN